MIVNEKRDVSDQRQRARELLLTYLRAADAPPWPGADGVTLTEVLLSYPRAAAEGFVPDLRALLEDHPELADALRDFFAE